MFLSLSQVLSAPYRRIYLIWGIVLIVGFIMSGIGLFDGYLHWYLLSLIGIGSQVIKMNLASWQAKALLALWFVIAFGGTLKNQLDFSGFSNYPSFFPTHVGVFWLMIIGLGQIVTGIILKKKYQTILGVVWVTISILMYNSTSFDPALVFYFIAFLTGIPYLWIAFKR